MSKGFSIVEFMIAITLGALLVGSVGTIYLSNKSTYRIQEALARLQENGRYANYFLNHEIRMAGFQGCAGDAFVKMTNRLKNPTIVLLYNNPILGYDGLSSTFSPALPSNLSNKVAANTDVIEIRMASNTNVQLSDDMKLPNNPLKIYDRLGIQAGEVVMVSNCIVGDIFIAGSDSNATVITHNTNDNTSDNLSLAYPSGSQIMRYAYYAYYIKNTGRNNSDNQPINALVRQDLYGTETEIADGVDQMRIVYGVDTNNDKTADVYQTATQVNSANNWSKVISLKVNLLLSTNENVNNITQPYTFNGSLITPNDRKLRREWESFITIRNRGLPS